MRQSFIVITLVIMLVSCNLYGSNKLTSNIQTAGLYTDTTQHVSKRHILIEELKKLRQTIASNDKEKIAAIFRFPLSDTTFSIYLDDGGYNEQFKLNGNQVTRAMFMRYFKQISTSIWLDRVKNLFRYINVDSLLRVNSLKYDAYVRTKPCYYSYKIDVDKNYVTLSMKGNSNENYKSKNLSEDDLPENSSEYCEHDLW